MAERALRRMPEHALLGGDPEVDPGASVLLHLPCQAVHGGPEDADRLLRISKHHQFYDKPLTFDQLAMPESELAIMQSRLLLGTVVLLTLPAPPHPAWRMPDGAPCLVLGDRARDYVAASDP